MGASDEPNLKVRLAAHIKDMRRDLKETLELIELLRASCLSIEEKLRIAERHYADQLGEAETDTQRDPYGRASRGGSAPLGSRR